MTTSFCIVRFGEIKPVCPNWPVFICKVSPISESVLNVAAPVAPSVVNAPVDALDAPIVVPFIVPATSVAVPVASRVVNFPVDGVVNPIVVSSITPLTIKF